jgi:hypothetical protein
MGEKFQKPMLTGKLVDLMAGIDISRSMFPIMIPRDKAMEEVHHRDRHTTGPVIGPIYLRFWMNRQPEFQDEIEDKFAQYVREYNSLRITVQR